MQIDIDLEAMRRLTALERNVNLLYERAGEPPPYPDAEIPSDTGGPPLRVSSEVLHLAGIGATVNAANQYRAETGASIKDALNLAKRLSQR